jgi:3-oxoacyl-[acyl-carrier-protein] synthase II
VSRRRVFITGLGFVTPHGDDPAAVFDRLFRGESAVRLVRSGTAEFGSDVLMAPVAFDPGEIIPNVQRLFMARAAQMAVIAAHRALGAAGLMAGGRGPADAGVYVGCGLGGAEALEEGYRTYWAKRSRRGKPSTVPLIMANGPASHISMRYGIVGPAHTYSIACASSTVSIGEGFRALRDGYLDVAIAGGAEAMLNDGSVSAWERLGVLARPHAQGDFASSRPFDAERTGFVLGEGAVMLALETEERVQARGVRPIAEIVGYGTSSDAFNLTEPSVEGQERAMRGALADARVEPEHVGYLNAHATGTPAGDPVEVEAIKRVFGTHARALAVSSTKSMHGHLVGASGALEAAITALALAQQRVPPTAFLTAPDPACDLDMVPQVGRAAPGLELAVSNSFAFGGSNAALVLRRT